MSGLENEIDDSLNMTPAVRHSLPRRCWHVLSRAAVTMSNDNGFIVAGHMAFTAFLAFFPFMIFMAAVAGFVGRADDLPRLLDVMYGMMPEQVVSTLQPVIEEIVGQRSSGLLTVGILGVLWAASSGVEALRLALNNAYNVQRYRALWIQRLQSILIVLLSGAVIFVISVLVLLGPIAWTLLHDLLQLGPATRIVWIALRYGLALGGLTGCVLLLHHFLPNRPQPWRRLMPGVAFTVVTWLIAGTAFSIYIGNFANYTITYGSLGSIAILLMFLYFTSLIFIYGAYINGIVLRLFPHPEDEQPA